MVHDDEKVAETTEAPATEAQNTEAPKADETAENDE